jgi:hypothetical protein
LTEKNKKAILLAAGLAVFAGYFIAAARPLETETVLKPEWYASVETGFPMDSAADAAQRLTPFQLAGRFGYVDDAGRFLINREQKGYVSMSPSYWSEYTSIPASLDIMTPGGTEAFTIDNPGGYPLFLDGRLFVLGKDQCSVSAYSSSGALEWTYESAAPITDMDAAGGLVLLGSLDGAIELLGSSGQRVFYFVPGGSRLEVILGCRISRDGSLLAVVSGIDEQRFLLLEKSGNSYNTVYHEFLGVGFRRGIQMAFIGGDSYCIFECEGGAAIANTRGNRNIRRIKISGDIIDIADTPQLVFCVSSPGSDKKNLTAISLDGGLIMNAPFKSGETFLYPGSGGVILGGGKVIASFSLDEI